MCVCVWSKFHKRTNKQQFIHRSESVESLETRRTEKKSPGFRFLLCAEMQMKAAQLTERIKMGNAGLMYSDEWISFGIGSAEQICCGGRKRQMNYNNNTREKKNGWMSFHKQLIRGSSSAGRLRSEYLRNGFKNHTAHH